MIVDHLSPAVYFLPLYIFSIVQSYKLKNYTEQIILIQDSPFITIIKYASLYNNLKYISIF